MRKLVATRLFRCVLCLVLVCCIVVNCCAIKVSAFTLTGTAIALFGDDAIALIAACIIGLGVMADTASQISMLEFRYLCDQAYDAMVAAGEWVVDGAVTVYNCATELWDYGVDCGMVQWLHDWLWHDSGILSSPSSRMTEEQITSLDSHISDFCTAFDVSALYCCYVDTGSGYQFAFCKVPIVFNGSAYVPLDGSFMWHLSAVGTGPVVKKDGIITKFNPSGRTVYTFYGSSAAIGLKAGVELQTGVIAPPGTDIETEYGEYIVIVAPNGVPDTGGDGSGDDQPKIPIIPVPVLPSYEETIRLPQEDIWKGNKVETEDPDTGGSTDPSTGTDTDNPDSGSNDPTTPTTGTDNPDSPGDDGSQDVPLTPDQLQPFVVDLRDFFPFCIPFDLYDFFQLLDADPVAPVFHWEIQDLAGNVYSIDIDLSAWDSTALFFRRLQLLVFTVGLAMASRKFIKW